MKRLMKIKEWFINVAWALTIYNLDGAVGFITGGLLYIVVGWLS